MKKRVWAAGLAVWLIATLPLRAAEDKYEVKRFRVGLSVSCDWSSLGEPSNMRRFFLIGVDLGVMVTDRIEIFASPVIQQSLSIDLFGINDTFAPFHFLLGGYFHLLPPGPGLDLKAGGGLDYASLKFAVNPTKNTLGYWVGAAAELPLHVGFVQPRFGLEARYSVLKTEIDKARDFGGFQVAGTFRLGF